MADSTGKIAQMQLDVDASLPLIASLNYGRVDLFAIEGNELVLREPVTTESAFLVGIQFESPNGYTAYREFLLTPISVSVHRGMSPQDAPSVIVGSPGTEPITADIHFVDHQQHSIAWKGVVASGNYQIPLADRWQELADGSIMVNGTLTLHGQQLDFSRSVEKGVPQLHSFEGAKTKLYLDFSGSLTSQWNGYENIVTPAFAGTNSEIEEIFEIVADHFSVFNVDVTTVRPENAVLPYEDSMYVHVGGAGDWFAPDRTGAVLFDSFAKPLTNVAFVFSDNLTVRETAFAISIKLGNAFGLYFRKDLRNLNSPIGAIMANSYAADVAGWIDLQVETPAGAFIDQNEFEILASDRLGFGLREDDHLDMATDKLDDYVLFEQSTHLAGIINDAKDRDVVLIRAERFSFVDVIGVGSLIPTATLKNVANSTISRCTPSARKCRLSMSNTTVTNVFLEVSSSHETVGGFQLVFSTVNGGGGAPPPPLPSRDLSQPYFSDFNSDNLIDENDIDILISDIIDPPNQENTDLDVDADGRIDFDDLTILIIDFLGTAFGDANLDGKVDLDDLLTLNQHFGTTGGWAQGDFNADGRVDFGDFQQLRQNYGFPNQSSEIAFEHCDMNADGNCDHFDIDTISNAIRSGRYQLLLDLDLDGAVASSDRDIWIHGRMRSTPGDTNLDGVFSSTDFVFAFQYGQYSDEVSENSGWAQGDWNGDGEFDSADLVLAFTLGGFQI
ncbi:MAG: dockerin type I domain-containing protein [Pirellulaceae bacterium]